MLQLLHLTSQRQLQETSVKFLWRILLIQIATRPICIKLSGPRHTVNRLLREQNGLPAVLLLIDIVIVEDGAQLSVRFHNFEFDERLRPMKASHGWLSVVRCWLRISEVLESSRISNNAHFAYPKIQAGDFNANYTVKTVRLREPSSLPRWRYRQSLKADDNSPRVCVVPCELVVSLMTA